MVFQVPMDVLRPVQLNPNLELGEGAGSVPAMPGKGLDLGVKSRSYAYPAVPGTRQQQDPSPESQQVGRVSGVTSQELSLELGKTPTCLDPSSGRTPAG